MTFFPTAALCSKPGSKRSLICSMVAGDWPRLVMATWNVTWLPTATVSWAGPVIRMSIGDVPGAGGVGSGAPGETIVVVAQAVAFSPPAAVASQQLVTPPARSARKLISITRCCLAPSSPSCQRSCRPVLSAGGLPPR